MVAQEYMDGVRCYDCTETALIVDEYAEYLARHTTRIMGGPLKGKKRQKKQETNYVFLCFTCESGNIFFTMTIVPVAHVITSSLSRLCTPYRPRIC